MLRLLKKYSIFIAICIAFFVSGWFASSIEDFHNSLLTSTAIFGVSFFSLIGSFFKFWNDFWM